MTTHQGRCLLTTGSREFDRKDLVIAELNLLTRPTFVMHGGARGADRLVSEVIHGERDVDPPNGMRGITEIRVPYLNMLQKRGGHKRNEMMLEILIAFRDAGWDCFGMAFHHDIKNPSPGTNGMVRLLQEADFTIVHIDGKLGQVF